MKRTAIIFPGQGSQYVGMGRDLYDNFKIVKETYEEACDSLSYDIKKLSFYGPLQTLTLTKYAQPAILTHSISALRILESETSLVDNKSHLIVAGHSLGEISALTGAGSFNFFDAVKLVSERAIYMHSSCPPGTGTMAAIIGIKSKDVNEVCRSLSSPEYFLVPANFNSETQTIISGHVDAIKKTFKRFSSMGARTITLSVSAPFHSPYMNYASLMLKESLENIAVAKPSISYIANYNAKLYGPETDPEMISINLVRQVYSPVQWLDTMKLMKKMNTESSVEIGPGKVLTRLMQQSNRSLTCKNLDKIHDLKAFEQSPSAFIKEPAHAIV